MDIALIIGVILGLAAMIGSIAYALFVEGSAGGFGNFLSAPSFGIVFGGMIASIFVAFPMPHVVALGKAIGAVLKPADDKMGGLVDEAVEVADVGRKGAADLEKAVDGINNYFFKDGVLFVSAWFIAWKEVSCMGGIKSSTVGNSPGNPMRVRS